MPFSPVLELVESDSDWVMDLSPPITMHVSETIRVAQLEEASITWLSD